MVDKGATPCTAIPILNDTRFPLSDAVDQYQVARCSIWRCAGALKHDPPPHREKAVATRRAPAAGSTPREHLSPGLTSMERAVNQFEGLVDALKREAAEFLWRLPQHNATATPVSDARERLMADGYCVIPGFIDSLTADALAASARSLYGNHPEYVTLESNGTDKRIYGAEQAAAEFRLEDELRWVDALSRAFYWTEDVVWFQMLGKISYQPNGLGSGSGWHRDSPFSHQFKAILYLTDVDEKNGPFEYIRGSHAKKSLAEVSKCLKVPGSRYRFSSEQIEQLENSGTIPRRTSVTGPKGTLLLTDSRGLHRGSPLVAGERLAVTRYYFPRRIPREFTTAHPLTGRLRR
jgi:hypothetical protein